MQPILVLQIAALIVAVNLGMQTVNGYKMSGDMPSTIDWASVVVPGILAFVAPMLKKWFPWLDNILPNPSPIPGPAPAPTPGPAPAPDGNIDWTTITPILLQFVPLLFSKGKLNLLHLVAIVQDGTGKMYPISYGTPPVDPVSLLVPASSLVDDPEPSP